MKYSTKIYVALSIVIMQLIAPSCKKSDPAPVDPSAIFQNKNWKLTALTANPAENGITDIYNDVYEACERDNLYKFTAGNVFILDEGPTKCDPADPQTDTGTWHYDDNSKILNISFTGPGFSTSIDYVVQQINENSFVATLAYQDMSGVGHLYTYTYNKQ